MEELTRLDHLPLYEDSKGRLVIQIKDQCFKRIEDLGYTFDECRAEPNKLITMALIKEDLNELKLFGWNFSLYTLDEYCLSKLNKFLNK